MCLPDIVVDKVLQMPRGYHSTLSPALRGLETGGLVELEFRFFCLFFFFVFFLQLGNGALRLISDSREN